MRKEQGLTSLDIINHSEHSESSAHSPASLQSHQQDLLPQGKKEAWGTKWDMTENMRLIMFMDYYKDIFRCKSRRKSFKIYKGLAEILPRRTPRQCRSRYQKIMKASKNFSKAKRSFIKQAGELAYEREYIVFTQLLEGNNNLQKLNEQRRINRRSTPMSTEESPPEMVGPIQNIEPFSEAVPVWIPSYFILQPAVWFQI